MLSDCNNVIRKEVHIIKDFIAKIKESKLVVFLRLAGSTIWKAMKPVKTFKVESDKLKLEAPIQENLSDKQFSDYMDVIGKAISK